MKLSEKKLQELKDEKISIENLNREYLYNLYEITNKVNIENILLLLNENICSFKQIVDKFKSMKNEWNAPCLFSLIENKKLFEELTQNNKLTKRDLEYMLNKLKKWHELENLCRNTPLIEYVLDEFVLNKKLVDRLNRIIEKIDWCKAEENIHTIFECIEYYNENNEEVLKLSKLNKTVYLLNTFDLNEDQKLEIAKVSKDNEIAQNRLKDIIDNKLESNYDFDSLIAYLKKIEKKSLINI